VSPLYRALTRLDVPALTTIAASPDPKQSAIARAALPLISGYRTKTGDRDALVRAAQDLAALWTGKEPGEYMPLVTHRQAVDLVMGREFTLNEVNAVLPGPLGALPLRDFINFYPYDLRCLPAIEALCVWVRA
jgi:hypothetical protein